MIIPVDNPKKELTFTINEYGFLLTGSEECSKKSITVLDFLNLILSDTKNQKCICEKSIKCNHCKTISVVTEFMKFEEGETIVTTTQSSLSEVFPYIHCIDLLFVTDKGKTLKLMRGCCRNGYYYYLTSCSS